MKKISYTLKSLAAVALMVLPTLGANAAPAKDDLLGDYTFSADVAYEGDYEATYGSYFSNSFDFKLYLEGTSLYMSRFINEETGPSFISYMASSGNFSIGTASCTIDDVTIGFSNASSTYTEDLYFTVNADGSFTCEDFKVYIMEKDGFFDVMGATIATFSNVHITKASGGNEGGGDEVTSNVPGNYTVTASKYAAGSVTGETVTFTMSIDEKGYLTAFAGYDNISEYSADMGYGNNAGLLNENSWSLSQANYLLDVDFMSLGGPAVVLGSDIAGRYANPNLRLAYTDGAWTLSNFTLWSVNAPWTDTPTSLIGEYQVLRVVKEGEADPLEDFAGTHDVTGWWKAQYTNASDNSVESAPNEAYKVTSGEDVSISINNLGQLTALAGYELPTDMIGYGYYTGSVNENVWTLPLNRQNNILAMDDSNMATLILGGALANYSKTDYTSSEFSYSNTLSLTYNESTSSYTISDFTVWMPVSVVTSSSSDEEGDSSDSVTHYRLAYVYSSTEIEPYEGEEEPPVVEPDPSIVGLWNFSLDGHYIGDWSLGQFDEEFMATLDGTAVTFASTESQYNIVAEFTSSNTLLFKQTPVVDSTSTYVLTQSPYVNNSGITDLDDLTFEEFTAIYDAEAGTITFPENSGLRYGYFNASTGELSYWDDAFDLLSASKVTESSDPELSIDGEIQAAGIDGKLYVMFNYTATNLPEGSIIYAEFYETDEANNKKFEVTDQPAYFEFELPANSYNYTVVLRAENNGETVVTSNAKAFQATVTGIDEIMADGESARFFNLQGIEVANPEKGSTYIRVQGNKTAKVIF